MKFTIKIVLFVAVMFCVGYYAVTIIEVGSAAIKAKQAVTQRVTEGG